MLKNTLRVGYAPVFFLGFLGAAAAASRGGLEPWPLLPLLGLAIATTLAVERVIPYETRWNEPHGDAGRDAAHVLVNELSNTASVLALPLVAAVAPGLDLWPRAWPLWLQLVLAIGMADLGITLAHFASHRSELLWRFHAVHHSVERMYGVNGLMKHPLHQAFELVCGAGPLLVLGLPQNVAWLFAFAVVIQLMLQHSNADLRVGALARVWAVAPVHRFHHVNRASEGDVNFGLFTTLWDHLLGTARYEPLMRLGPGDLGIDGRPDYPRSYAAQLLEPFGQGRV